MLINEISGKCTILHYISIKSKHVCQSALSAELLAIIEGFHIGFFCRDAAHALLGRNLSLRIYTDSRSLCHLAAASTHTKGRRIQVDLQLIREACENRKITDILWITGASNPADALTKTKRNL